MFPKQYIHINNVLETINSHLLVISRRYIHIYNLLKLISTHLFITSKLYSHLSTNLTIITPYRNIIFSRQCIRIFTHSIQNSYIYTFKRIFLFIHIQNNTRIYQQTQLPTHSL